MGVSKRPNGKYRAKVYVDGREIARHFDLRRDAVRWEAEQKAAHARGAWIDPTDRTTVSEYAMRWVASRPYRPSTRRNFESLVKHHITATPLGRRRLSAVRPSEVQAWVTDRSAHMSPLRLRNLVGLLRSVFRDALLDRLVGFNPVGRPSMPSFDQARVEPLTVDQVRKLIDAAPPRNKAMILFQAATGLRIGELIAVRVQDIDFLRRTVRVEYQFAPNSKVRSDPKTPRSKRTIPVPAFVIEAVSAHLARWPAADDGTVFTTRYRMPYRHDYGGQIFKRAVIKAGLPPETTSHDLRHHYASMLIQGGESVVTVAERLGRTNPAITLKVYSHLFKDAEDRTRKAIEAAWAGDLRDQTGTAIP